MHFTSSQSIILLLALSLVAKAADVPPPYPSLNGDNKLPSLSAMAPLPGRRQPTDTYDAQILESFVSQRRVTAMPVPPDSPSDFTWPQSPSIIPGSPLILREAHRIRPRAHTVPRSSSEQHEQEHDHSRHHSGTDEHPPSLIISQPPVFIPDSLSRSMPSESVSEHGSIKVSTPATFSALARTSAPSSEVPRSSTSSSTLGEAKMTTAPMKSHSRPTSSMTGEGTTMEPAGPPSSMAVPMETMPYQIHPSPAPPSSAPSPKRLATRKRQTEERVHPLGTVAAEGERGRMPPLHTAPMPTTTITTTTATTRDPMELDAHPRATRMAPNVVVRRKRPHPADPFTVTHRPMEDLPSTATPAPQSVGSAHPTFAPVPTPMFNPDQGPRPGTFPPLPTQPQPHPHAHAHHHARPYAHPPSYPSYPMRSTEERRHPTVVIAHPRSGQLFAVPLPPQYHSRMGGGGGGGHVGTTHQPFSVTTSDSDLTTSMAMAMASPTMTRVRSGTFPPSAIPPNSGFPLVFSTEAPQLHMPRPMHPGVHGPPQMITGSAHPHPYHHHHHPHHPPIMPPQASAVSGPGEIEGSPNVRDRFADLADSLMHQVRSEAARGRGTGQSDNGSHPITPPHHHHHHHHHQHPHHHLHGPVSTHAPQFYPPSHSHPHGHPHAHLHPHFPSHPYTHGPMSMPMEEGGAEGRSTFSSAIGTDAPRVPLRLRELPSNPGEGVERKGKERESPRSLVTLGGAANPENEFFPPTAQYGFKDFVTMGRGIVHSGSLTLQAMDSNINLLGQTSLAMFILGGTRENLDRFRSPTARVLNGVRGSGDTEELRKYLAQKQGAEGKLTITWIDGTQLNVLGSDIFFVTPGQEGTKATIIPLGMPVSLEHLGEGYVCLVHGSESLSPHTLETLSTLWSSTLGQSMRISGGVIDNLPEGTSISCAKVAKIVRA